MMNERQAPESYNRFFEAAGHNEDVLMIEDNGEAVTIIQASYQDQNTPSFFTFEAIEELYFNMLAVKSKEKTIAGRE